jgi:hypothetical protein
MSDKEHIKNIFRQPVGESVPGWSVRSLPPRTPMLGNYTRLEPLDAARHAADLMAGFSASSDARDWTYLSSNPPADFASYEVELSRAALSQDPLFHAIYDAPSGRPAGIAAYLRIDPANGVIEVGHILMC